MGCTKIRLANPGVAYCSGTVNRWYQTIYFELKVNIIIRLSHPFSHIGNRNLVIYIYFEITGKFINFYNITMKSICPESGDMAKRIWQFSFFFHLIPFISIV